MPKNIFVMESKIYNTSENNKKKQNENFKLFKKQFMNKNMLCSKF